MEEVIIRKMLDQVPVEFLRKYLGERSELRRSPEGSFEWHVFKAYESLFTENHPLAQVVNTKRFGGMQYVTAKDLAKEVNARFSNSESLDSDRKVTARTVSEICKNLLHCDVRRFSGDHVIVLSSATLDLLRSRFDLSRIPGKDVVVGNGE